jgi:V/A-type H+/Na+-transporting ATPase subunit I
MRLRPTQARWFETYVPSEQTLAATEVLVKTGVVQLELDPTHAEPVDESKLHQLVSRFREQAAAHAADLPSPGGRATSLMGNPATVVNEALYRLRVWGARIDYVKERLGQLRAERDELLLLSECLSGMERTGTDVEGLFKKTRFLFKSLFACPRGWVLPPDLEEAVAVKIEGAEHDFVYIAGVPDQHQFIERLVGNLGCDHLAIPAWLSGDLREQARQVQAQISHRTQNISKLEAELDALRKDETITEAQDNIETLRWYLEHARAGIAGRRLSHITGWTAAEEPQRLQEALHDAKINVIVRFPNPPATAVAPVTLLDSWWARPFQPLRSMWGTPGPGEVDPTGLLAVLVPLLFGYMFPDVGHGLVLAGFAALSRRRHPMIRFLIPCGLAAAAFGVLFGEVFGFHGLLAPLWIRPLDDPLPILVVPLVFGVALMLLGLVFAGVEAYWRGKLRDWLLVDGAVLLLYASALAGIFVPEAFWLCAVAILHYVLGSLVVAWRGSRWRNLPAALGQLLMSALELLLNTCSFLRVGAFALAHAALSHAVITLAGGVENPIAWSVILALGNLFAIALEGLVVFVQTTRLMLFEFFVRFLQAEGRLFKPARAQNVQPAFR